MNHYHSLPNSRIYENLYFHLQTLKFKRLCPKPEHFIKFLEINGENLKKIYLENHVNINSLNLAIPKHCPNLKSLTTRFNNDEVETLKAILNGCQHLESMMVFNSKGDRCLNGSKLLEVIANCSPKNFYMLKICVYDLKSKIFSEELESILISWANRPSQKSLYLVIVRSCN